MATKQNLFFTFNKKAFTLIEVLISISILVLIFTFLYSQLNLAQKSTKKTTVIEKSTSKRAKIIELIYADFISSMDIQATRGKKYDRFVGAFDTQNSLYEIENPYIKYVVIEEQNNNKLIRIEGKRNDIGLINANSDFYIDVVLEGIKYFKVLVTNEEIEFFIKAKDMKDIYFKINRLVVK